MKASASDIVRTALAKVGSTDWAYSKEKSGFSANSHKCNLFVYEVIVEAGAQAPTVPKYYFFNRPPTAGEWANPAVTIPGWVVVNEPLPGDVCAEGHNYSDATGHVAIVVAEKTTVSATAVTVVKNDWGFRADSKPTFRRLQT